VVPLIRIFTPGRVSLLSEEVIFPVIVLSCPNKTKKDETMENRNNAQILF
jgi:hypothetical protein